MYDRALERVLYCTVRVCVCVCDLAVTKTKQQDSFYFDPSPINQNVVEGASALMRCDVSDRRQITFYWTVDGRQLANTSRRHQIDSDLYITRVDRTHDDGSFRCIATNVTTGIALRSTEARLNISCTYFSCILLPTRTAVAGKGFHCCLFVCLSVCLFFPTISQKPTQL